MLISHAAVQLINPDTGALVWLSGFLDTDHVLPLFSSVPCAFPIRLALKFSVQLGYNYSPVKVVFVCE